jgi:hypothetical protein
LELDSLGQWTKADLGAIYIYGIFFEYTRQAACIVVSGYETCICCENIGGRVYFITISEGALGSFIMRYGGKRKAMQYIVAAIHDV